MHPKTIAALAVALITLAAVPALADTISITSSAVPTVALNPSSDSLSLSAGSATLNAPGQVTFQSGDILIGDSQIPDQVIPFFFSDTVTINGIARTLSIFGQNNVTNAADYITILAGSPVNFGAYTFTLNSTTYTGTAVGQDIPLNLSGTVAAAPTPEPATLLLLATGLAGGVAFVYRAHRSQLAISQPA